MKRTCCVSCGEPDYGDCLTPDGLCFGCDVEETANRVTHEQTLEMMERWVQAMRHLRPSGSFSAAS